MIEKHHIYQADGIQIVSFKASASDYLLSADRQLIKVARKESIPTINIEDAEEVKSRLSL